MADALNLDEIEQAYQTKPGDPDFSLNMLKSMQAIPDMLARIRELERARDEWQAQSDLHKHMVITCGAAASHSDSNLTRTGAYAGRWNSQQAEQVRSLRNDRDRLREKVRELEQDAARVDWMSSHEAWIAWSRDGESCRVFHRDEEGETKPFLGWKSPWFDNARAAIDAAVATATGKMETTQ